MTPHSIQAMARRGVGRLWLTHAQAHASGVPGERPFATQISHEQNSAQLR